MKGKAGTWEGGKGNTRAYETISQNDNNNFFKNTKELNHKVVCLSIQFNLGKKLYVNSDFSCV